MSATSDRNRTGRGGARGDRSGTASCRHRSARRRAAVTTVVLALTVAAFADPTSATTARSTAAPHSVRPHDVVATEVSFRIRNQNASGLPCPADGALYTVRGRMVGPRWALQARSPLATLYIHGFGLTGLSWELDEVPGYDYLTEMARLGHVSVAVDLLGYSRSDKPDGRFTCIGAYADITHQVIEQLRAGTYSTARRSPVGFQRVVLAGHDIGGPVVEIEAYSFGDIDGLMVMGWAEQGVSGTAFEWAVIRPQVPCLLGGQRVAPGGPSGYETYPPSFEEAMVAFHDVEPAVVDALRDQAQLLSPCGVFGSLVSAVVVNQLRLGEIEVPVYLLYADHDFVFSREGAEQQADRFSGSNDVTTTHVDTGHFPWLERKAPSVRAEISNWLWSRGFVSRR